MAIGSTTEGSTTSEPLGIDRAEVLIGCDDVPASLAFYTERLGFRVDSIYPAEAPEVVALRGYGMQMRLAPGGPHGVRLRLSTHDRDSIGVLQAPEGTLVELVDADPPLLLPSPAPTLEVVQGGEWGVGRAGMQYRDLIPNRQGGRFVASHIRLPSPGPVPDYVHYHKVRFQMIYCHRGWVRLVYEDQGEPFVMSAGDCVLQPPRIRHRVLESGDDLHVVEVGCPAVHETWADPRLVLPTGVVDPDRDFAGQRFVHHRAATATWEPAADGFERRSFGLGPATGGVGEAAVLRPAGTEPEAFTRHDAEFHFTVVLNGTVTLRTDAAPDAVLAEGAAAVIPAEMAHAFVDRSADLQLLRVTLPAAANL